MYSVRAVFHPTRLFFFFFLILFLKKFLVDIQIITRILLYWLSFFTGLFEARNERWISWLCFSLGSQFLHLLVIWVLRFCSDHQPSLISCNNEYGQPNAWDSRHCGIWEESPQAELLFSQFEPMIFRLQRRNFTIAPRLTLLVCEY